MNTGAPTIGGSPVAGQTLTSSAGTWLDSPASYSYQWQECDSSGLNCSNLSGATAASYLLAATDIGHRLRVIVTATNAAGSSSASSDPTNAVLPPAPSNTAPPVVSGTAEQGDTLTTTTGTWTGSPSSYSYQWQDCTTTACSNIPGATGSSYTLQGSDVGSAIDVIVTATNSGGSMGQASAHTATVVAGPPSNQTLPVISGTAQQGQTLTTSPGTWTNSPTSYSYQWQDCTSSSCSNISGATASSYTPVAGDVGDTIDVVVTAKNAAGSSTPATSAPTKAVTSASSVVLVGNQTVESNKDGGKGTSEAFGYTASATGTATGISVDLASTAGVSVGLYADNSNQPGALLDSGTVSSNTAGWVNVPLSKGIQIEQGTQYWLAIAATSSSATVTYYDSGSAGSNLDYSGTGLANPYSISGHWASNPASVYVTGTPAPPTAPSNTSLPTVSGAPQQGNTLTASHGSWYGTTPMSYAYQWQDCTSSGCTDISGATSSSYTLQSTDVGDAIDVVVTATNSVGSKPATSAQTATVTMPGAPSNTALPMISGTAQQGQTLVTSNGSWTNNPTSYTYQWQDCTSSGCTDISQATSSTYAVQSSEVGDTIDVVVTAHNAGGSAPATSAQTPSVTASGLYTLPADRTFSWDPGLNAVGGIPDRTSIYKTISPSGGDDTATIQAALDSCPKNGVVQLTAGVFHISGQGLSIENSYCTLRGAGPGPGNFPVGKPPADGTTTGTYLVKPTGTNYPVVIIGPRWGPSGNPTNLTSDAVRGSDSVTVASTSGLAAGQLVVVDETTDPNISHWNSQDPENNSGWFEEPNRPLGDVMEIASISGNTVTFTTPFPITYAVSQSAHLYPLDNQVEYSGIEDLYAYGGEGGDGGGGIHLWNCAYCWVDHVEDTWTVGAAIHIDQSFRDTVRDSYFHHSQGGLYNGGANYGIGINWYTSNSLIENNISIYFNKVDVMRSAGGGNVFGYNYMDDGADQGGSWFETNLNSSHMTTPHYELFEGNEAANFDQDDRWGNSVYITVFRNQLLGQLRDFPNSGPQRAAGVTQWHWWQSFVGNVLGWSGETWASGYEAIDPQNWGGTMWMVCWQNNDNVSDGGKCQSTLLRDGNYDYFTKEVHWHGIGGTGAANGLTPPANSILPASMYLSSKPGFFGSNTWPWVNGSDAGDPLPGQLPARQRYDAGTPNTVVGSGYGTG